MRTKQFYVSNDVYRAYWLLAKAANMADPPDAVADQVLRKHLETYFPQVLAHQKEVDALEKKLIEQLTKPSGGYLIQHEVLEDLKNNPKYKP